VTVESLLSRMSYTGNGALTTFAYPFQIFDAVDLEVYLDGVLQTYSVHYTLSGVGVPTGGNVVFVTAPANGTTVLLFRSIAQTQLSDLPSNDKFPSTTVETALDKLTMLTQQLNEVDQRTLKLAITSAFANLSLPDPVANLYLRWKADLSGIEAVALTGAGVIGVPVGLTDGGTGATTALAARQNLGVDGIVRKTLTNRTGASLAIGDIVTYDAGNDNSVKLDDVVSSRSQFVVALAAISNTVAGEFATQGIVTVNTTGAIARGQYVRKSATARVVEDAGVAMTSGVDAPTGALGVALTTAAAGQVTIALFGKTYGVPTSSAQVPGSYKVVGLVGKNNAATPNTKYDMSADAVVLRSTSDGSTITKVNTGTLTNDTSVAGPAAGGKDQAGAFAANNWIHFYFIVKADGTGLSTLSSLTTPPTGPTLPATYTHWAYVGAVRYNATPLLVKTMMRGAWVYYQEPIVSAQILTGGTATVETSITISSHTPPNTLTNKYFLLCSGQDAAGASGAVNLRVVTAQNRIFAEGPFFNASTFSISQEYEIEYTGSLFYLWSTSPGVSKSANVYINGYKVPNGGE
jgi:hypothetical protein